MRLISLGGERSLDVVHRAQASLLCQNKMDCVKCGAEPLTWAKYKKATFDNLRNTQSSDGSWQGGHVGPVFITAVHLTILQLEKGCLPLYQK